MLALFRRTLRLAAVALLVAGAAAPAHAATEPSPVDPGSSADAATGDDLVSFGIGPAGPQRPDDRPFLSYTAAPGTVIYDHVAVINQDDAPVSLDLSTGDVTNAEGGGLTVLPSSQQSVDAGTWVDLDPGTTHVEVPAQTAQTGLGYVVVPFTLTVPADAEPGDHVGGIVATLSTTGQGGENSPTINLEQRVAARVYIRVDGDAAPGLTVSGVRAEYAPTWPIGPGTMTVTYTLRNDGNIRMAVEPSVRVSGPFGLLPRTADGDRLDELLPGGQVQLTTTVDGVWPLVLQQVDVGARTVAAPAGADPGLGTVHGTTSLLAMPWLVVGLLALLVVLLVIRVLLRRRRAAPPSRGGGSDDGRGAGPTDRREAALTRS